MTNLDATVATQIAVSPNFNFGFSISDLYQRAGLVKLDQIFMDFLHTGDEMLHQKLVQARAQPEALLDRKSVV